MTGRAIATEWMPNGHADRQLLALYAYWLSLCRDGQIPFRKDVNPTAIPRGLLRSVCLIDVVTEPRDFRVRLAGTAIREGSGQEVTGLLLDEIFPPEYALEVREHWNSVVDQRRPLWGASRVWSESRSFMEWQGVVMPVQSEDGEVTQLLGAAVFNIETANNSG